MRNEDLHPTFISHSFQSKMEVNSNNDEHAPRRQDPVTTHTHTYTNCSQQPWLNVVLIFNYYLKC